ncbi:hypothetical protein [Hymenobacter rubripertinctus]|uniref:hypothetical protein n=1 Tax=Hymenobacter rubripertinctus TaxID=2029981 RepID=UPI0011C38273|nr:hypothetical protein [Hymenobacter rubripertinctus]
MEIDCVWLENYVLPQVRLADTAAARRLNTALGVLLLGEEYKLRGDDTLTITRKPQQPLHQGGAAA